MVMPAIPYPTALSANTRAAVWSDTGVDSAVWLFSTQKITGSRRTAQKLMASCHSPSDVAPSPINDTATRSLCVSAKANPIPAIDMVGMASGAAGG